MRPPLAFLTPTAAALRAATPITATASTAASQISIDHLTDRTAYLSWHGPTRATVLYTVAGAAFASRRLVAHPNVTLSNLRPGVTYSVNVTAPPEFDAATTFTTVACATDNANATGAAAVEGGQELPMTELSRLEIRAGRVVECVRHPDADSLYVEKVDVGEGEPRVIVSGLVKYVAESEMVGRDVVVLCNLKPRAMRGVTSHGMLLCASDHSHTQVDPLAPPKGTPLGELITFQGHRVAPVDPGNRATKAFDRVCQDLKTDDAGVAMYKDVPFATSLGPCVSPQGLVGLVS